MVIVYILALMEMKLGLLNVSYRVIQERETRAKLKKEKEEVTLIFGNHNPDRH